MERCLLIDGDILAYQTALKHQTDICFDPEVGDLWVSFGHFDQARVEVEGQVHRLMEQFDADGFALALTDSGNTFRQEIYPRYKSNRKDKPKPMLLAPLKSYMIEEMGAYFRPGLEGDDILGILSTSKHIIKAEQRIIFSLDKDMRTIPGLYLRDKTSEIEVISEEEADWWHMYQTLTGDTTDGYPGCPGVGPKGAEKLLDGLTTYEEMWPVVVEAYGKKGIGEEEALLQARVARILRKEDYNFTKKEAVLWKPPTKQ